MRTIGLQGIQFIKQTPRYSEIGCKFTNFLNGSFVAKIYRKQVPTLNGFINDEYRLKKSIQVFFYLCVFINIFTQDGVFPVTTTYIHEITPILPEGVDRAHEPRRKYCCVDK